MRSFFCRRTHAQNEHGFTVLEAINVHMTRMPSFWKLKMLRDAQIQIAWALRPTPIFWEKHFDWKELLCTVCVCKEWDCRFWNILLTTIWICASLSIFSLQKDGIRVMWTLIASKKVNPCSFCACVLLQKIYSFSGAFLSFGNIKDLLKATHRSSGFNVIPKSSEIINNKSDLHSLRGNLILMQVSCVVIPSKNIFSWIE